MTFPLLILICTFPIIYPHFVTSSVILSVHSRPDARIKAGIWHWLRLGHGVKEIRCRISALSPSNSMCLMRYLRPELTRWCSCCLWGELFSNPGSEASYPGTCLNSFTKFYFTTDVVRQTKPRLLIEIVSKLPGGFLGRDPIVRHV